MAVTHITPQVFNLARTDPAHMRSIHEQAGAANGDSRESSFGTKLMDGLNRVNELQHTHDQLSVQAITDPDSVDPHDVTIASAKANLALGVTKAVVDRVIQAYNKISTLS